MSEETRRLVRDTLLETLSEQMMERKEVVEVHILHHGLPLCGFTRDVPRDWPTGHFFVVLAMAKAKPEDVTCRECESKMKGMDND